MVLLILSPFDYSVGGESKDTSGKNVRVDCSTYLLEIGKYAKYNVR